MKRVYTVATSHLDTIWSWDFETTVSKYIYNTLVENFDLFKKYPGYVFSFEGSYRYELMEEYYPELFEKLKGYVESGKWNVTGSAYENGDVNCPSPEALFRNILIGNTYFSEKFNKRSCDIYLPDCFGFGWALPSIAHHANLKGFTTQKLAWGSAYGVPFDIGKWYGVDGNYIYASLNPHDYYFTLTKLRDWDFVNKKLKENAEYGLEWTYLFHGIGDRGGAPEEATVKFVEEEIEKNPESDIEVIAAPADKIYRDIEDELSDEVRDKLPEWKNELVMQNHGVGGYTSRAIGKRWNSKCQDLGDMAERFGVLSEYFGVNAYNGEVMEKAWKRAVRHQFHDDTPGTSVQRAYRRSWNDYAMSINQLVGETETSLCSFSKLIDSGFCAGTPVAVFNSLEFERTDLVKAEIGEVSSRYVRVFAKGGKEVPSQITEDKDGKKSVLFIASVPALGVSVFDIRESDTPCKAPSSLSIGDTKMENQRYTVTLNRAGNISSVYDKTLDRELLEKPVILGLFDYTGSRDWPAWEMNYEEANREPEKSPQLVSMKVAENGAARVSFEVIQKYNKTEITTYICLTEGSDIVEVYNQLEWQSMRTLAKHRFAFTASNEEATFDLGLGAIKRGNMSEKLFEVPAQRWADITDKSGDFGVSVISECKYGWDKFNDNTLRLTAVHTPKKNYRIDSMQSMMDLGLNLYSFAITSHKGEVGNETQQLSRRFVTPLVAVKMKKHGGVIGGEYSFGSVNNPGVIMRCLKKKYHSDENEYVVRFNEGANEAVKGFEFTLGEGIESAYEAWASEEYRGEARVENGKIICDFEPYEVKTFVFRMKKSRVKGEPVYCRPLSLEYNADIDFIPKNLRRDEIKVCGITFKPGNGMLRCRGEKLSIKEGNKLALLCANRKNDEFANNMEESYARWDLYDFGETAYIKGGRLGYEFTHSFKDGEIQFAKGLYFWVVICDNGELPDNKDICVLAASEISPEEAGLITPLEDRIENNRPFTFKKNLKEKCWYLWSKLIWNINDKDDYFRHNNNGKNGKRVEQGRRHFKTRTIDTVGH